MFFCFPLVFVRLPLDLLIFTELVMGMANDENFGESLSRSGISTGGDDHSDGNESFWQSKCPNFVHEINEKANLQTLI